MNQKQIKKCIVCEKGYEANTVSGCKGRRSRHVRGKNSHTCSKKCSRIYTRISEYVHSKWIPKNKPTPIDVTI